MPDTQPKPAWYRPTPDRVMVGLLVAQGALLLADRFSLFGLSRGDLFNVKLVAGLVGAVMLIGLLWLVLGLLLRRPSQFGIRCLLLLTVAVAIASSRYGVWTAIGTRQRAAMADVRAIQARICSGKPHRQFRYESEAVTTKPGPRELIVGISFAIEEASGCGCCYFSAPSDVSDEELGQLGCFDRLERLEVPYAKITDAGLAHLRGLKNLRHLDLSGNAITDAGLAHLRGLKHLERLDLSDTEITDAGFVHLGVLKNLEQLSFGRTAAMGTGGKHLVGCEALKKCGSFSSNGTVIDAVLSAEGACTLGKLPGLEELYGLVARPAPGGTSAESIEFDGHPKLRVINLRNGLNLKSVRLANLPALESVRISYGDCMHLARWPGAKSPPKGRSCEVCSPDVEELRLENLPKLKSLVVGDVQRLVLDKVPNLADVTLNAVREQHIPEVGRLSQLRSLGMRAKNLPGPDAFAKLGHHPYLERLIITGDGLTDASLAMLEGFPALKKLFLSATGYSGDGLRHLRHLKSLEELTVAGFRDSGEPLSSLTELSCLKSIHIRHADIGTLKLFDMPNLEGVSIVDSRIGTLELANLPELRGLTATRHNDDMTVHRLSVSRLPKLKSLQLAASTAEEPLEHVKLEQLPALCRLDLPGNYKNPRLTDDCFENIATFVNLRTLDVSNSRISDQTIDRLMRLPRLTRVEMHNTRTTEAAANKLRTTGPAGIRVSQSGPR